MSYEADIAWQPAAYPVRSNIQQFMDEFGYESHDELVPGSEAELAGLWGDFADDTGIVWREEYDNVFDRSEGVEFADWFPGGRLNAVETILDQRVERTPNRVIYHWEDERGRSNSVTYSEMADRVDRLAKAFRDHGIGPGDVVAITFPLHPNGFVASLACLRIGAVFTQIFPGYGAMAMGHRIDDSNASMVVTADGYVRGGEETNLLARVNEAIDHADGVNDAVVYDHVGLETTMSNTTVHDWDAFVADASTKVETEVMKASNPAFIAYSSGTTGNPKGTIHTHASLLAMGIKESKYHFDLSEGDTLMWVTDFGWIIVPIWLLAGGPALGATTVLPEGAMTEPSKDRLFRAIEAHDVTTFGIAPTGARKLRDIVERPREEYDLEKLRILGSTGEPWDEDAWQWFLEHVGGGVAPIINASGGTELGGAILSPTPGTPVKPGTLYGPAPGVAANIYDKTGSQADEGYLVIELPIPGMTHSLTAGDERYLAEYWQEFDGVWNQNDWACRDDDDFWYITGRADDTMNVAGRRITAPEMEEAVLTHPAVEEVAIVPTPGDGGQTPVAFVTLGNANWVDASALEAEIREAVSENVGAPYRPTAVYVVQAIPRTQTGKIPRSLIESSYAGESIGDVSTLENGAVLREYPTHEG